jgi:hypothetical protein
MRDARLCKRVCERREWSWNFQRRTKTLATGDWGTHRGNINNAIEVLKELLPNCRVRIGWKDSLIIKDYQVRKRYLIPVYATRHEQGL